MVLLPMAAPRELVATGERVQVAMGAEGASGEVSVAETLNLVDTASAEVLVVKANMAAMRRLGALQMTVDLASLVDGVRKAKRVDSTMLVAGLAEATGAAEVVGLVLESMRAAGVSEESGVAAAAIVAEQESMAESMVVVSAAKEKKGAAPAVAVTTAERVSAAVACVAAVGVAEAAIVAEQESMAESMVVVGAAKEEKKAAPVAAVTTAKRAREKEKAGVEATLAQRRRPEEVTPQSPTVAVNVAEKEFGTAMEAPMVQTRKELMHPQGEAKEETA